MHYSTAPTPLRSINPPAHTNNPTIPPSRQPTTTQTTTALAHMAPGGAPRPGEVQFRWRVNDGEAAAAGASEAEADKEIVVPGVGPLEPEPREKEEEKAVVDDKEGKKNTAKAKRAC